MGYTHYYRNKKAFTDAEWQALCEDARKLFADSPVPLANGLGDEGTSPVIDSAHIIFNGVGEDSHETAIVSRVATGFEFTKTARKPYDSVVIEFFKLIRKYDPNVRLSSNGGEEIFGPNPA